LWIVERRKSNTLPVTSACCRCGRGLTGDPVKLKFQWFDLLADLLWTFGTAVFFALTPQYI